MFSSMFELEERQSEPHPQMRARLGEFGRTVKDNKLSTTFASKQSPHLLMLHYKGTSLPSP